MRISSLSQWVILALCLFLFAVSFSHASSLEPESKETKEEKTLLPPIFKKKKDYLHHPIPSYKKPIYVPKPHPIPVFKPKPVSIPIYKPKPVHVPISVPIYKPKPVHVPVHVHVPIIKPKPIFKKHPWFKNPNFKKNPLFKNPIFKKPPHFSHPHDATP